VCGLARVTRQASAYPEKFKDFRARHCAKVTDVPVGHIVFCLPIIPTDMNWRAVILIMIYNEVEEARLTWIHPECLQPLSQASRRESVRVDLTVGRGAQGPSIEIDDLAPGMKYVKNELILDARWTLRFAQTTDRCTGHCLCICCSLLREPTCVASVLRFAQALKIENKGRVACEHAKHRSVAAANILRFLFSVDIDFHLAARDRTASCCNERAADNVACLLVTLRMLPEISGSACRPLSQILGLPE
jgi:hypothetical protein